MISVHYSYGLLPSQQQASSTCSPLDHNGPSTHVLAAAVALNYTDQLHAASAGNGLSIF